MSKFYFEYHMLDLYARVPSEYIFIFKKRKYYYCQSAFSASGADTIRNIFKTGNTVRLKYALLLRPDEFQSDADLITAYDQAYTNYIFDKVLKDL